MKKVVSVLLVCLLLALQLPIGASAAEGTAAIPTDGLDLWLEADSGIEADADGYVTAWTSKVDGLGKDAPYVLNQYGVTNDARYTKPVVRQTGNGQPSVYFDGTSLATADFTAYANNDQMTLFLLTKPVRENTDRSEVSYLVQNGKDNTNGIFINRKSDGQYEVKDGTGKGHAFKTSPTDYAVLMVKAQTTGDAKEFVLSVNNTDSKTGGINGSLGMTKFRLGHRSDDEVAAFLIYQRALSEEEQAQVYQYLYDKYIAAPVYPTIKSAAINAAGGSITLTADSALSGSCAASDFQVTAGGESAVVSAAEINAAGGVTLTLSASVTYGQAVQVSYTGTGLVNSAGNALAAFSNYAVDVSAIPVPAGQKPVIVGAAIGIKGTQVQLTADLTLGGSPAASDFQVTGAQTGAVTVQSVTIAGKDILLTLSAPLRYQETATVSYTGNSVVSAADNGVMEPFANQEATPYTLERIPTNGLDLWLEADAGISTDDKGAVTAWESKVNALGKNTPYVLDQLSTINDAGYAAPTVRQSPTGKPAVYFNGKSLSSASFEPYQGTGEMTLFLLTKYAKGNDARSNVSYLVQNGEEKDKNGFYINRKNDGQYEIKDGGGTGHAFVAIPDGYTILTVTAKWEDGQRYFYLHQNGVQEKRVAFGNSIDMTKYRLGHRADDEIAACLVYQRAVSDLERESVYQYLYEKYVMESAFAVQDLAVQTTADGYADVSGKFVNTSIAAVPAARAMCASYDGTILEDIGVFDLTDCTLGKEHAFVLRVKLPENQENASVRLFLWDGFDEVRPLMKNQLVTITNPTE